MEEGTEHVDANDYQYPTVYTQKPKVEYGVKGRSSFIPSNNHPGPGQYSPREDYSSVKEKAARWGFGTSNRDGESARYISSLHNQKIAPVGNPGPGTYRTHKTDHYEHNPMNKSTPSWGFGTAPQREDEHRVGFHRSPGPIYDQSAPSDAPSYTFAPMGSMDLGMERQRSDWDSMYLGKGHAEADKAASHGAMANVGPASYDVSNQELLSPRRRTPNIIFGKSTRDCKDSMFKVQHELDPMSGTAATTPGAIYDLGTTLDVKAPKFGQAQRTYSPELGEKYAGPYLGRGFDSTLGVAGPGPGAYELKGGRNQAISGLGDAATFKFGTERADGSRMDLGRDHVPGPGAYTPKEESMSRATTAPAFSLGANIRSDFTTSHTHGIPGPGTYDTAHSNRVQKTRGPAYTMGVTGAQGRSSFVDAKPTPGAGAYAPTGDLAYMSKRKGYSFGMKDRTIAPNSMVTVRYQGPLASAEAMGTHSPGPGMYDTSKIRDSTTRDMPHLKFGTASREAGSRLFVSRMHAEAVGNPTSPGPGTYDQHQVELADVTSRYRRPATAAFSTAPRFKTNYSTF